jgi:hypothetical protein
MLVVLLFHRADCGNRTFDRQSANLRADINLFPSLGFRAIALAPGSGHRHVRPRMTWHKQKTLQVYFCTGARRQLPCCVPVRFESFTPPVATICSDLLMVRDASQSRWTLPLRPPLSRTAQIPPLRGRDTACKPSPCASGCDANHHNSARYTFEQLRIRNGRCPEVEDSSSEATNLLRYCRRGVPQCKTLLLSL